MRSWVQLAVKAASCQSWCSQVRRLCQVRSGFSSALPALMRPVSSEAEATKSSKSSWPTSRESASRHWSLGLASYCTDTRGLG